MRVRLLQAVHRCAPSLSTAFGPFCSFLQAEDLPSLVLVTRRKRKKPSQLSSCEGFVEQLLFTPLQLPFLSDRQKGGTLPSTPGQCRDNLLQSPLQERNARSPFLAPACTHSILSSWVICFLHCPAEHTPAAVLAVFLHDLKVPSVFPLAYHSTV